MDEAKWMKKKDRALRENNKALLYESCRKLAEIYKEDRNFAESLSYFKRAQDVCEKTVDKAVLNRLIGEVYCDMEMYDNAIKYQKKHLELSKQEGNHVEIQRALATLGRTYFIQGQSYTNPKERRTSLQHSYDYYLKSEEICDLLSGISSVDLAIMKARLYMNMGVTVEALDISEDSISYLCKSISISKNHDLKSEMVPPYIRLAEVYLKQQKHSEALATIQKCIPLINPLTDSNTLCELLMVKADVYVDMFDFTSAKVDLARAYKLKHLNSRTRKDVEKNLRIIIVLINNENKLMELNIQQDSEDKLDLDQAQVKKRIYEQMGDACSALGNHSKAVHFYHKMLDACETVIKISYSTELGIGLGDSLESCITDFTLVISSELVKDLASCYVSLAESYKDNKQYDLAVEYFNRELTLHRRNFSEACKTMTELCEIYELQEKPFSLIYGTLEEAKDLAEKNEDKRLQRIVLENMRKLCERYDESIDLERVNKELVALKQIDSSSSSDDDIVDSPLIGNDINLEELSDLNSDEENARDEQDRQRGNRKRAQRSHFLIKRNDKGETALHVAAARGNLSLVHSLLKQGHPVKVQDSAGWLPLHEAANHGHTQIVAALVDAGADPNDKGGTGISPLHDAAANGYLEVIEILLDKGASTAQRTNQGETARKLLEECKERVEKAQGCLDPAVAAHFEQVVRKLRVPDELTTGQVSASKPPSELKPPRERRRSETREISVRSNDKRSEFRSQLSLRNRRDVSPESDTSPGSSPDKRFNDLRLRSESPVSCTSDPASPRRDSSEEESATKEYQKAISNLRSAKSVSKALAMSTFGKPQQSRVRARQFLAESEVGDDWLEQDVMEGGTKKRKYREEDGREGETKRVRSDKKTEVRTYMEEKTYDSPSKPATLSRVPATLPRVPATLPRVPATLPRVPATLPRAPSFESIPKRKSFSPPPQRILAPVSRTKSFEPSQNLFPEDACDFVQTLARGGSNEHLQREETLSGSKQWSRSNTNLSTMPQTLSVYDTQMASIKIKIEAHTFLIPILRDDALLGGEKKIIWLKQEASERYYRLEGVTPELRIKTQDGAFIDDNDPLASVLQETLVLTEVVNWHKPPPIERYHQLCSEARVRKHKHFESALTADTHRFTICTCTKSAPVLLTLFRTFLHWTDLVEINLSRSFLQDNDVKAFSEHVTNLCKLQKLSIACNHVTHVGFKHLSEQCVHFSGLRHLDVSFNPLTDAALPHLNNMVAMCPQLSNVNLSHTNLTRIESDLNLYNIESIDVSRNRLGASQVRKLLSLLNAELLDSLNLSSILETPATLRPRRTTPLVNRSLTPCENQKTDTHFPCKSPNLYFDSGKRNNEETRCDLNLPDIISMVPRYPTQDGEDHPGNATGSTIETSEDRSSVKDRDTQDLDKVGYERDENCLNMINTTDFNIINTTDLDQENQDELDRLLNSSPIMNIPDSEHIPVDTTRERSKCNSVGITREYEGESSCNSVGITREVVLFLEQSERCALKRLSLSDIDMSNDEAQMLFNVLKNNAICLDQLNVSCNRNLSQRSIELLKSAPRHRD